ncbi:MAG: hypothetical protein ACP5LK_05415 [Candidatus Bipolaricaulaceae bacterium]
MKNRVLTLSILAFAFCAFVGAQPPKAAFQVRLVLKDQSRDREVQVLLIGPKSAEPVPWVAFSPAFLFRGEEYRSWGERLAAEGMAVALVSYAYSLFNPDHRAWTEDLLFLLSALPKEARRYGISLDPKRVALVGHSLGGKLSFLAAAEHPVLAVVGLDQVGATRWFRPGALPLRHTRARKDRGAGPRFGGGVRGAGTVCAVCWPGDDPQTARRNAQTYVSLFLRARLLGVDAAQFELLNLLSHHEKEGLVLVRMKPEDSEGFFGPRG